MLEDPSLSRQWVARRLQRALSLEYWGGAARRGLARSRGSLGPLMAAHAASSASRANDLEAMIRKIGSTPYPSWGLGARLTPPVIGGFARLGAALAGRLARVLAEHTLSEYRTLEAFIEDAPGVAPEIGQRVAPMRTQAAAELTALREADAANG